MRLSILGLRLAVSLSALAVHPAKADINNQVPSCYAANQVTPSWPVYNKLFVVLIDQTVLLDPNLQEMVLQSINQMIQPGTHFVVGEFSAFSQGRYLNIVESGVTEASIPADQIGNLVATSVKPVQQCLQDQLSFARRTAETNALQIMKDSTSSLDQSDILMSLKDISAPVKVDPAKDKVVLLVTDGLENSSVTSFYAHGTARDVDPAKEMVKAQNAGMIGDFSGAKIYVVGGAVEPPENVGTRAERDGYRNPQMLEHLQDFWSQYFQASDASLGEFGTPALLDPVQY